MHGEVLRLHEPARALTKLDHYERSAPAFPEGEYLHSLETLSLRRGGTTAAWIYLYRGSTERLARIVSGDFLRPGAC